MDPSRNDTPAELVRNWVEVFNRGDSEALAAFYTEDAVNHQVAESPVRGRAAIRRMFAAEFAATEMTCLIENIFEDGEWAILEWRDPIGLRGCGFFRVVSGRIVFQRGYWDKLSFMKAHGKLPLDRGDPRPGNAAPADLGPYVDRIHRLQVIGLWKAVFGYDTAHNQPALAIDKKLAVQDGLFFVATSGSQVIGTIMAGYDGHRGWLYSVAVDPAHRMGGVGRALVAHAEHALAERGCMKINLQIVAENGRVTAFYRSLGYQVDERISMSKRIKANIPDV